MTVPETAPGEFRPRLRRRLMLAFAGYTLLVGTLLGALSMAFVYVIEDEFFARALRVEAERQRAHHAEHGAWTAPVQPSTRVHPRGEGLPADLERLLAANLQRREFEGDGGRHYHIHVLHADGTLLVSEVSDRLVVRPMRDTLLLWLLGAGGGVTLVATLLAWMLAHRASAPLARLAQRVAQSSPDALPERLSEGLARDEVGELALHLDRLHARTRAFIAREQAFTADASHELRTPLAVLSLACERLKPRVPEDLRRLVGSMQVSVWQLQQTVELLLASARERRAEPAPAAPLLPVVERLVLAHAPLLEQEGVQLEVDVPPEVTRPWPPAFTQVLLGNLLANSIAHAQTPGVRIHADAGQLSVCNASAPPPSELLGDSAAGRSRGVKGPASTGHGIGLSIARRLADERGLALELSHRGGWTCATLREKPGRLDAPGDG